MRIACPIFFAILVCSCQSRQKADLLVFNATIYTVDSAFTTTEAFAVKDGKIIATGKTAVLRKQFDATDTINAQGRFIYPGLIDAHTHFYRYGLFLQTANLIGTSSWEEILQKLQAFATSNPEGWLNGFGWDQNDWAIKEFPGNDKLNELFPNRPVVLTRIDGHAAIANNKALQLAGIQAGTTLTGGTVETKNGKLTGILVDNAIKLLRSKIPPPSPEQITKGILQAQENCVAQGLTTVDDCGLDHEEISFIDSLQKQGSLKMRVYAMMSDARKNYDYIFAKGKIKTDHLNVRSFKVYADGALGSRGACLLQPYSDKPGWQGFLLNSAAHFDSVARILFEKDFQMCTHAIGDSANRVILNIYAKYLSGKNNLRWRIEHAQVINEKDFHFFGDYSIIPSVQPTHATSDMYWAAQRLGPDRVKSAYAYHSLQQQNGWIPLGTDFPVEDISPIKTFYAAVVRKDAKGWPGQGYQPENALSRQDALRGMTIWAARSNFEEAEKGSIETGKWADFIITDIDLLKAPSENLLHINVLSTYIQGEKVYKSTQK